MTGHLTFSVPNTTIDVLLKSAKWHSYFPFKQLGRIFLFILHSLQCVINSYILTTKQLILYWYCKEKIDVDKLTGAERLIQFLRVYTILADFFFVRTTLSVLKYVSSIYEHNRSTY